MSWRVWRGLGSFHDQGHLNPVLGSAAPLGSVGEAKGGFLNTPHGFGAPGDGFHGICSLDPGEEETCIGRRSLIFDATATPFGRAVVQVCVDGASLS